MFRDSQYLFFDTEFTGLHKDTTLISLGIVDESEHPRVFYAEFTDYDRTQVDDWVNANVIKNLILGDMADGEVFEGKRGDLDGTYVKGNKEFIRDEFCKWATKYYSHAQSIQMVSDVCHYDFVLFIDLWNHAFNLPEKIVPYCKDINEDIAKALSITYRKAFDYSREKLFKTLLKLNDVKDLALPANMQHNALYDAYQIATIFELKEFIILYGLDEELNV